VDVVLVALHLVWVARIGLRAVSRLLRLRAGALGIKNAPWPQTIIHGVIRLAIVRREAARGRKGWALRQAPFTHGLSWRLARRLGLGTGKLWAVVACDAPHHQRTPGARALDRVHGIGGGVAASWTGETLAEVLTRLLARMGRPAASLKDGGRELPKAVDFLGAQGRASPCLDDLSHAVASLLQRV
jgi:hypothetical protein